MSFFFKQWGGVRKAETGRALDGRTYDELPEKITGSVVEKRIRLSMLDEVRAWDHDLLPA